MNLACPRDELDDLNRSYPISIQFASSSAINFLIKNTMTTALLAEKSQANFGARPAPNIQTPFADLMLKPEKLEAALHDTAAAPQKKTRGAKTRKIRRTSNEAKPALKNTKFELAAPSASSVKLAADFTDWEKAPLEMNRKPDGIWSAIVALSPGQHHYRFIVDGTWCDDPNCAELIPNGFGTGNSVIEISR